MISTLSLYVMKCFGLEIVFVVAVLKFQSIDHRKYFLKCFGYTCSKRTAFPISL